MGLWDIESHNLSSKDGLFKTLSELHYNTAFPEVLKSQKETIRELLLEDAVLENKIWLVLPLEWIMEWGYPNSLQLLQSEAHKNITIDALSALLQWSPLDETSGFKLSSSFARTENQVSRRNALNKIKEAAEINVNLEGYAIEKLRSFPWNSYWWERFWRIFSMSILCRVPGSLDFLKEQWITKESLEKLPRVFALLPKSSAPEIIKEIWSCIPNEYKTKDLVISMMRIGHFNVLSESDYHFLGTDHLGVWEVLQNSAGTLEEMVVFLEKINVSFQEALSFIKLDYCGVFDIRFKALTAMNWTETERQAIKMMACFNERYSHDKMFSREEKTIFINKMWEIFNQPPIANGVEVSGDTLSVSKEYQNKILRAFIKDFVLSKKRLSALPIEILVDQMAMNRLLENISEAMKRNVLNRLFSEKEKAKKIIWEIMVGDRAQFGDWGWIREVPWIVESREDVMNGVLKTPYNELSLFPGCEKHIDLENDVEFWKKVGFTTWMHLAPEKTWEQWWFVELFLKNFKEVGKEKLPAKIKMICEHYEWDEPRLRAGLEASHLKEMTQVSASKPRVRI